uniref:Uncharacterized protein n=1 Tax=Lepeophtheirus salmonis TaxID=72036 RepID=A0A0K2UAZ1_LEPSM
MQQYISCVDDRMYIVYGGVLFVICRHDQYFLFTGKYCVRCTLGWILFFKC